MSKMSCNTFVLSLLAMSLLISGTTYAAPNQDPAPASSTDYVPSDADLAKANCIIGEERFLPGDYYYCLGGLTYGQHNYGESTRFFTTAASWASKPAQYVLGVMALNGDHQPKNRALALAWFALASERPDSRFKAPYDEVYKASTRPNARRPMPCWQRCALSMAMPRPLCARKALPGRYGHAASASITVRGQSTAWKAWRPWTVPMPILLRANRSACSRDDR